MEDEFLESDVVFSDYSNHVHNYQSTNYQLYPQAINRPKLRKTKKKKKINHFSVPINIPENRIRPYMDVIEYEDDDHDDYDDLDGDDEDVGVGGERLPPHLIVARRVKNYVGREIMACSFYIEDGKGRILRGRNLCEVRNSILRLTGFYET